MQYGPEFVSVVAKRFDSILGGVKFSKIEGGIDWLTLQSRKNSLFISWNQDNFGMSLLTHNEAKICKEIKGGKISFSLAMSKYISGASLIRIKQIENDRILRLDFQKFIGAGMTKNYSLILELMGRLSNAILIDSENMVIEPARHVHPDVNRYRSILPGYPYVSPPPLSGIAPEKTSEEDLRGYLKLPIGLGKPIARVLLECLEEEDRTSLSILEGIRSVHSGKSTLIPQKIGNYDTLYVDLLPGAVPVESKFLDVCYRQTFGALLHKRRNTILKKGVKIIRKEIKSLARHIDGLKRQLKMATEADVMMQKGQAIYANLNTIPARAKEVSLPYWDEAGETIMVTVSLSPSISAAENAEKYFKRYRKYQSNVESVTLNLDKLLEHRSDLEDQLSNLEKLDDIKTLDDMVREISSHDGRNSKKKDRKKSNRGTALKPPHIKYEIGNSHILVGLNERGNRYVTFKEARSEDLWFHVHEAPGSHVILRSPPAEGDIYEKLLLMCSSLALYYSRIASSGSHFVDFTQKKHVRHIQGAGPAQVTYKNSHTRGVTSELWRSLLEELREAQREDNS